jgi:outer membrane lipoprotein-sorting protein
LFKRAELSIRPDADEQVFQDVLDARRKNQQNSPITRSRWRMTMKNPIAIGFDFSIHQSRWRMTVKNPITKLAAAAVITVACIAGIVVWTHTGSGIALANALAQVQQITAYMYQMTMTVTVKAPTGPAINQNVETTVVVARDYGTKTITDMIDPNGGRTTRQKKFVLPQERVIIAVMPTEKRYIRMDLDDTLLERIRKENYDPSSMLARILECKYESLGRSTLDGVDVEGFHATDPDYLAGMGGQADVKIWVSVETQLPVRMEIDIQMGEMKTHGVMDNYQWGVAVTAADFKPVIPDDYTTLPGGPVKTPAVNEEGEIAGLKLFADLFARYPEKLDYVSLMTEFGKLRNDPTINKNNPSLKQIFGSEDASADERAKKVLDIMLPIQGAALFYAKLTQEKKDPAYYGNLVTPQDADKVLMRWKVSDNQYRVIFGSLHAETVSAEVLAELEKGLPK